LRRAVAMAATLTEPTVLAAAKDTLYP